MEYTLSLNNNHPSPFRMQATHKNGATMAIDAGEVVGGKGSSFSPMEYVVLSLAGCSCIDIISILRKAKQPYTNIKVLIKAARVAEVPAVFSNVHLSFIIEGNIKEITAQKALKLSIEKYCSVAKMLRGGGVNITYDLSLTA